MTTSRGKKRRGQSGMALVETAIVLLLLVTIIFGTMEYGWLFFKIQQITNTVRAGARKAVLPDSTNADVALLIQTELAEWDISSSDYTLVISSADITALSPSDLITLTITVPYSNVELLGMPMFPTPTALTSTMTMAREGP
jgi:Flp pilus assembly protein TadG